MVGVIDVGDGDDGNMCDGGGRFVICGDVIVVCGGGLEIWGGEMGGYWFDGGCRWDVVVELEVEVEVWLLMLFKGLDLLFIFFILVVERLG